MALTVLLGVGLAALAQRVWGTGPLTLTSRCVAEVAADDAILRAALTPEQTANAALIAGIAQQRGLPARAATIALATAIQESGLRNIDYGDRDSLGLFQQRPSQDWGTEEQVQDPVYATNAFYDALVRIDGYESMEITVAAQEVQRSGFPEAYADHEAEGRALASALYGLSPASLTCRLRGPDPDATTDPAPAQDALLAELQRWGPPGAAARTDADGAVVLAASAAGDPVRTSWALAQSVVAWADRLGVTSVAGGGLVGARAQPDAGGQPGAAAATRPPTDVLVRLGG